MDEPAQRVTTVEIVFTFVRRFVVFGLGCWTIGNALLNPEERATQLIIGMIMVGVLPIENFFHWRRVDSPTITREETRGE
jgi:hypothetical protein